MEFCSFPCLNGATFNHFPILIKDLNVKVTITAAQNLAAYAQFCFMVSQ